MLFRIEHELPGRLRLRCPRYSFNLEQAAGIEAVLEGLPGVCECRADASTAGILIRCAPDQRSAVLNAARRLEPDRLPPDAVHPVRLESKRLGQQLFDRLYRMTVIKGALMLLAPAWLTWPAVLLRARPYAVRAFRALRARRVNVDVLDALAILVSCLTGHPGQAANIMYLLRVSEALERYTVEKSRFSLADALAMQADAVWLCSRAGEADAGSVPGGAPADAAGAADGSGPAGPALRTVPLSTVRAGDVIRVYAGALIPLDGEVCRGEALVNQSSMTGEAEPVYRRPGHSVLSGTTVVEGELDIRVRSAFGESRIQQIMLLLESSERNKAAAQRRAESLADRLVPLSLLLFGGLFAWTGSLTRAAGVLMVDYSCALRLAMPINVMTAMLQSSRRQIAVRGGHALERFAEADIMVFDKTGTVTTAVPTVVAVVPMPGYERDDVLRMMACIEEHFPHSLALAIVRQARRENLHHEEVHTTVNYIIAHGVSTTYNGEEALVGSAHFLFEDSGIELTDTARALIEQAGGYSLIFLAVGGRLAGFVSIDEPCRPEVPDVLRALRRQGFRRMILLTGDGEPAARRVALANGFDHYESNLLPEDKAAYIRRLQAEGHRVVMIGDGVNDSPALSQADVSVAMQDASDIARNVSDISLLSSRLDGLVLLRHLSRSLMGRMRATYGLIMGFNSLLLAGAAANVLPATTVAVLHNGSTLAVTGANMRPYPEGPPAAGDQPVQSD